MTEVKANMPGNYTDTKCDQCKKNGVDISETQKHILECPQLLEINVTNDLKTPPEYKSIFRENISKMKKVEELFQNNMNLREKSK